MNTTTRRFARTTLEAFPSSEPGSIQGPYRSREPSALTLLAVAVGLVFGALAFVHVVAVIWEAAP